MSKSTKIVVECTITLDVKGNLPDNYRNKIMMLLPCSINTLITEGDDYSILSYAQDVNITRIAEISPVSIEDFDLLREPAFRACFDGKCILGYIILCNTCEKIGRMPPQVDLKKRVENPPAKGEIVVCEFCGLEGRLT